MIGEQKMQPNTVFSDSKNFPVCNGWLPEGYTPFISEVEPDPDSEMPIIIWLKAANNSGKKLFSRIYRKYSIDKSKMTADNRFMDYDEYLDTNAVSILRTRNIRLVRRYCLTDNELEELREELRKVRDSFDKLSVSNEIEYIVQGIYGASGAKLYEADINGQKRYLLLTVKMVASEYGIVNKLLQNSINGYQDIINSMNGFNSNYGFFGGYQPYQQQVKQPVSYDTSPNTPFGQHRTDGFTSSEIIWKLHNFSGLETPVQPSEDEVRDFLSFTKSTEYHPQLIQMVEQTQQQMVMNQMQANQMMMNSFQQGMRMQQQGFERSFNAMKSVSDMSFDMTAQRVAADNAAFDRQVRMNHEAIMGVNTYQRTDGTNVEVSTMADRVFQSTNNPASVIGVEGAGPTNVPFGWTELEKLK